MFVILYNNALYINSKILKQYYIITHIFKIIIILNFYFQIYIYKLYCIYKYFNITINYIMCCP